MRSVIAVVIGLIAIGLISLTFPKNEIKPRGLVLPANQVRSATNPQDINFFSTQPLSAKLLGKIRVARHYTPNSDDVAEQEIKAFAKNLAAEVGAKGIVINFFAHSQTEGPQAMYVFWGDAIYTEGNL